MILNFCINSERFVGLKLRRRKEAPTCGFQSAICGFQLQGRLLRSEELEYSDARWNKKFWTTVWKLCLPKKIIHFIWRLYHNCLPTADNLVRRNIQVSPVCHLCEEGIETAAHLFNLRELFKLWEFMGWDPGSLKIEGSFERWMVHFFLSVNQKERGLFSIFLWEIWTLRNAIIFDGSPKRADVFAKDVFRLWDEAATAAGIDDGQQRKNLSGWVSPPMGTAKLNFDGAYAGSDRSGAGVIVRDSNGMVIGLRVVAGPVGCSARATEAAALREGLSLAKSCRISKLIVEGDAKVLLEDVERASLGVGPEDISEVRDSLLECIELVQSFDYIKINWIRREVNQVAHKIASRAREAIFSEQFFSSFPSWLESSLLLDIFVPD